MRSLGGRELGIELQRSQLFTYPSVFQPEISPATTIKAQAAGAVPIVVAAGGMEYTVRYGAKVPFERFAETVIDALRKPEKVAEIRAEMRPYIEREYDWNRTARLWEERLLEELS
jgi:glycosyltransferase involved in cell wall biosynthesis